MSYLNSTQPIQSLIMAQATLTKPTTTKKYDGPTGEEKLVNELIDMIQKGVNPWRKEWSGDCDGTHRNFITGKRYRGGNIAILEMYQSYRNYKLPLWVGSGQAFQKGFQPVRGSKGAYILKPQFVSFQDKDAEGNLLTNKDGSPKMIQFNKYLTTCIFNIECLVGKDEDAQKRLDALKDKEIRNIKAQAKPLSNRLSNAKKILFKDWCHKDNVPLTHSGDRAFYSPGQDRIQMPKPQFFTNEESYYATLAHECVHSTGHSKRLSRPFEGTFGSKSYAREELIAELGAFLICNRLQISSDTRNHAAYLDSWLKVLKDGPNTLMKVLGQATKASNLIVGAEVDNNHSHSKRPTSNEVAS